MPTDSSLSGSSSSGRGLILRTLNPAGRRSEVYVVNGLTIGRSEASALVLEDDLVDRAQAHVTVSEDGTAIISCVGPDTNVLILDDGPVRESKMIAGLRFRIGNTACECLAGRRDPFDGRAILDPVCPYCGAAELPEEVGQPTQCLKCNKLILRLDQSSGYPSPYVFPGDFGRYQAVKFVGRGGMGVVLKGVEDSTGRSVAIKLLVPDCALPERFEHEVAIMQQVRHPNVVTLLQAGQVGCLRFLVMEWMERGSLGDVIVDLKQSGQKVSFGVTLLWLQEIANGLTAIHAKGIIHRDIKPTNILLDDTGRAKIADLGIAKRIDAGSESLTATGAVTGTWDYMAPEQRETPELIDQRADQYSLGITIYELLTGSRPVGQWWPASQINATVPLEFDRIFARLLAPKPENRYADILALLSPETLGVFLLPRWSYVAKYGFCTPTVFRIPGFWGLRDMVHLPAEFNLPSQFEMLRWNYLEIENQSYLPLTDVSVCVVAHLLDGSERVLELKLDRLEGKAKHREVNVFRDGGFLGGDIRYVEAVLNHSGGQANLTSNIERRKRRHARQCSRTYIGPQWPSALLVTVIASLILATFFLSLRSSAFLWPAVIIPLYWRRLGRHERWWHSLAVLLPAGLLELLLDNCQGLLIRSVQAGIFFGAGGLVLWHDIRRQHLLFKQAYLSPDVSLAKRLGPLGWASLLVAALLILNVAAMLQWPCPDCFGQGTITRPCQYCNNGTVTNPCICGNGKVTCPQCNGASPDWWHGFPWNHNCGRCGNSGSITCPKCGGTKVLKSVCPHCFGKGKINAPCAKCKGAGWI